MKYIVLDIETTSLDQENTSILEVAALLVSNGSVIDKFSSFIKYEDEIPDTTRNITGITEEMVKDAPPSEEVMDKLKSFIRGYPVVSHNGFSFDFPILERDGIKFDEKYDSMELAFFVLPTSPHGHSMRELTKYFKLEEAPHRALKDCELEFEVVQKLLEVWNKKPQKQKAALNYMAERVNWWWRSLLTGKSEEIVDISDLIEPFEPYRKEVNQEILAYETQSIDIDDVRNSFTPSKASTDDYSEDRKEQKEMATHIAEAFNSKTHAVIEAGTGTGKSKAYLVPSVLFALKNNIPVVVSTHTKALQDQLFFKEIRHLKETVKSDLRVAVLKGKRNYVCLTKLKDFIEEVIAQSAQRSLYRFGKEGIGFTRELAALLLASWAIETTRGDWDELPFWFTNRIPERIETDICNTDELCTKGVCELYDEHKCFLAKARLRAKDADLAIVNHAIVLSGIVPAKEEEAILDEEDSQSNSKQSFVHTIFPGEAKFIVFDEAHHLEDDATSAWEHIITKPALELLLQQIYGKGKRRGVLDTIQSIAIAKNSGRLTSLGHSFLDTEGDLRVDIKALFEEVLPNLVPPPKEGKYSQYGMFLELPEIQLMTLRNLLDQISNRLESVKIILETFAKETEISQQEKILTIRARSIWKVVTSLKVITDIDPAYVRYLEYSPKAIDIKAALLSVAKMLEERVYNNFSSVILTSATLTIDGKFNFFDNRCGISRIEKGKVSHHHFHSSFDYKNQVQFFLPKGISYKKLGKEKHLEETAKLLKDAIISCNGGALILCTSFDQVEQLYEHLRKPLSKANIWLLKQSRGMSPTSEIRNFSSDVNSVLIGTETLWQGVDVPGESLRALFIIKILYRMPELPLIKARVEELDKKNRGSGFMGYSEPLAAMALKQGFGRLIRKKTDRGVVVMFEENLLNKPMLKNSLPDGVDPKCISHEDIIKNLKELSTKK